MHYTLPTNSPENGKDSKIKFTGMHFIGPHWSLLSCAYTFMFNSPALAMGPSCFLQTCCIAQYILDSFVGFICGPYTSFLHIPSLAGENFYIWFKQNHSFKSKCIVFVYVFRITWTRQRTDESPYKSLQRIESNSTNNQRKQPLILRLVRFNPWPHSWDLRIL